MPSLSIVILLLVVTLFVGCGVVRRIQDVRKTHKGIALIAYNKDIVATEVIWSPIDKNKILVTAYAPGMIPAEVYLFDLPTGQKSLLVESTKGNWFAVAWGCDGNTVLIKSAEKTGGFNIHGWWLMDINDKSLEYFMAPLDRIACSPDGKTIAALDDVGNNATNLIMYDIRTGLEKVVYSYIEGDYVVALSWSPDSHYVVFSLGQFHSSDLYIYDVEAGLVTQITDSGMDEQPAWSPRGDIIAFAKYSPNTYEYSIHLTNTNGDCEIAIPNIDAGESPTWSPDGKELAFIGHEGIYVLTLDEVLGRDVYQGLCP